MQRTLIGLPVFAALAASVWIGGAAALVTSAELDRRLHPLEYPAAYDVDLFEPELAPDELAPSADPRYPLAPSFPPAVAGCVL